MAKPKIESAVATAQTEPTAADKVDALVAAEKEAAEKAKATELAAKKKAILKAWQEQRGPVIEAEKTLDAERIKLGAIAKQWLEIHGTAEFTLNGRRMRAGLATRNMMPYIKPVAEDTEVDSFDV